MALIATLVELGLDFCAKLRQCANKIQMQFEISSPLVLRAAQLRCLVPQIDAIERLPSTLEYDINIR